MVLLYNDGTWKYKDNKKIEESQTPLNQKIFTKNKKSIFMVKSNVLNVGFYINPKTWSFEKIGSNGDSKEFSFQLKNEDLFGRVLTERSEISIDAFKSVALENARDAAPDMQILKHEYRKVNGNKVLYLEMSGTFSGMTMMMFGYYFSNSNGTVQLVAFTGSNLVDRYHQDIENFLNGLVEID
ncbi:hypothetical protein OAT16_09745 [Prolixibacteraceae bacterium]|nr:hypothetical protein [Prolixibacteraceae bacterium]